MRVAGANFLLTPVVLVLWFGQVQTFSTSGAVGIRQWNHVDKVRSLPLRVGRTTTAVPGRRQENSKCATGNLKMADQPLMNLAIGAVAGCVATAATFPIDAAKTRLQALNSSDPEGKQGVLATMGKILKDEGFAGLYKGSLPVVLGSAPETAIQLSIYDWVLSAIRNAEQMQESLASMPVHFQAVAGGFAGLSTVVATNPLEVLKIRAQTNNESLSLPAQIKELGFRGLFHGYEHTWFRDVPFAAMYFPIYTNMKVCAAPFCSSNLGSALVAGLVSGLMAGFITTPADVIMTAFHTGTQFSGETAHPHTVAHLGGEQSPLASAVPRGTEPAAIGEAATAEELAAERAVAAALLRAQQRGAASRSPIRIGAQLLEEQGMPGLFRGVQGRLGKMAPAMGISLCVYETLQRMVGGSVPLQTGPVVLAQLEDMGSAGGEEVMAAAGSATAEQLMAVVEAVGSSESVQGVVTTAAQMDLQMVKDAAQTACNAGEVVEAAVTAAAAVTACHL